MTLGPLLMVIASVAGGFLVVQHQLAERDEARRADIEFDAKQAVYFAALQVYERDVTELAVCLDGVTRSDSNRAQWEDLASIIEQIPSGNGVAYAERIRNGPLLSRPPRLASDCGEAPIPPEPPTRP